MQVEPARRQRTVLRGDGREEVEGCIRDHAVYARHGVQSRRGVALAAPEHLTVDRHYLVIDLQSFETGGLNRAWNAIGRMLDEAADRLRQAGWHREVAEAPAGHAKGL